MTFQEKLTPVRMLKGAAVSVASFGGLGTFAALWDNPLFFRMVPAGNFEIGRNRENTRPDIKAHAAKPDIIWACNPW